MTRQLLFLVLVCIAIACQPKSTSTLKDLPSSVIGTDYVKGLLTELSSDQMEGRKAGTEGAKKAADFIAKQFREIGLETFKGAKNYLQPFSAVRTSNQKSELTINGKEIEADRVLGMSNQSEFSWASKDGVEVRHVHTTDELQKSLKEWKAWKKPTIVLVNKSVESLFKQYRDYYTGERLAIITSSDKQAFIWAVTEAEELTDIKLQFSQTATMSQLQNVVGVLPGKSKVKEQVYFSGHYDHLGIIEAVNGDSIANGADDDASGVVAMISLAKHFKNTQQNERTLIFVAFTAEEFGLYGSQYFAEQIDVKKAIANVNIEMIGKESAFGAGKAFVTGSEKSDLIAVFNTNITDGFVKDPYPKFNLFYRSDNVSFVNKGIIAHTISTSQIDKDVYYHTVDDEIETIDIPQMTETILNIIKGVQPLVDGTKTPIWKEKQE